MDEFNIRDPHTDDFMNKVYVGIVVILTILAFALS